MKRAAILAVSFIGILYIVACTQTQTVIEGFSDNPPWATESSADPENAQFVFSEGSDYFDSSEMASSSLALYPSGLAHRNGRTYVTRPRSLGDSNQVLSTFESVENAVRLVRDSELSKGATILGFFQTRRHIVVAISSPDSPVYSVYSHSGSPIASGITFDQMSALEPDLGGNQVIATPGGKAPLIWAGSW